MPMPMPLLLAACQHRPRLPGVQTVQCSVLTLERAAASAVQAVAMLGPRAAGEREPRRIAPRSPVPTGSTRGRDLESLTAAASSSERSDSDGRQCLDVGPSQPQYIMTVEIPHPGRTGSASRWSASSTACLSLTRPFNLPLLLRQSRRPPCCSLVLLLPVLPPTRCCTSHSGRSPSSAPPKLFARPCRLSSRLRRRCGWCRRRSLASKRHRRRYRVWGLSGAPASCRTARP
jgi:hypothetical protein